MKEVSVFLQKIGFNLSIHSNYFNGSYISDNGIEITVIYFDSIIGVKAECKGLSRTLIDSSKINSVTELIYILSRNIFIKNNLPALYQKNEFS
ncbi:hypothetical protein AUW17_05230 [Tenacibaculum dicentrarchi]|nr:hypothetical protein AUW17_05230 [Tenacibaculum dicentrarchi]